MFPTLTIPKNLKYMMFAALASVAMILFAHATPVHATALIKALIQNGSFGTEACEYNGGVGVPSGCTSGDNAPLLSTVTASAPVPNSNANFPQAIGTAGASHGTLANRALGISRQEVFGNPAVKANAELKG